VSIFKVYITVETVTRENYNTYKEMSTTLLLDPENATLTVHTNSSKLNGPQFSFVDDPKTIPGVKDGKLIKIGDAHTHQVADIMDDRNRDASAQMGGDGKSAAVAGVPLLNNRFSKRGCLRS
jgi:hypothetical protein